MIHPGVRIGVNCLLFQQVTLGTQGDGGAVDKREDGVVYEPAIARVSATAAALTKVLRGQIKR